MRKFNLHGIVVIVIALLSMPSLAKETIPTPPAQKTCVISNSQSEMPCSNNTAESASSNNNNDKKQQQSLREVERHQAELAKEERLKVLFVDVNSVMETLGASMDWTANWIDGQFADGEHGKDKAKAWGHVIAGWEPREGEWSNFPVKFRVRAKLPNLENKAELILSDNEQEDLNSLPYETVRPEALKSSQKSLGAAVRFMHSSSENFSSSSRIGTGEGQLYVRSSVAYTKKFFENKLTFYLQPAIEYYYSDGLGGRLLFDTAYAINSTNELRYSYLLQDRESYEAPTWRNGVYSISAISDKSALIIGATVAGVVEPEYQAEFYKFSVRVRKKAIRSWIFIEVEPFAEFKRERLVDDPIHGHVYGEYERDLGIALRLEAHYGFH